MMMYKIVFEIHDTTTNEVLADNLAFDEVPELFLAYTLLYSTHNVVACSRKVEVDKHHLSYREEFKTQWFDMIEDIIDNLYNS